MLAEFKKGPPTLGAPRAAADAPAQAEAARPPSRPNAQEFWLLRLLLLHDELVAFAMAHLDTTWLAHADARHILSVRIAAQREGRWTHLAAMLDELGDDTSRSLATEAVANGADGIPNPEQQLLDVLTGIRNAALDRRLAALTQQLNQPGMDEPTQLAILQSQHELRRDKQQPLRPVTPR